MQLRFQKMNPSASLPHESDSASTLLVQPGVLVVKRHHILVRWSHWLNLPLLLGLILSGISIYWASPIYQQAGPEYRKLRCGRGHRNLDLRPMSLVNTITPILPTGFTTT